MTDHQWHADDLSDEMRASDADRERTAETLRKHHSAGRLSDDEFQERFERCLSA